MVEKAKIKRMDDQLHIIFDRITAEAKKERYDYSFDGKISEKNQKTLEEYKKVLDNI